MSANPFAVLHQRRNIKDSNNMNNVVSPSENLSFLLPANKRGNWHSKNILRGRSRNISAINKRSGNIFSNYVRTPVFMQCILLFVVIVLLIAAVIQYQTHNALDIPSLPANYVPTFSQTNADLSSVMDPISNIQNLVNIVDKLEFHDQEQETQDMKQDSSQTSNSKCDDIKATANAFSSLHAISSTDKIFIWPMPQIFTIFEEQVTIANLHLKYESNCDHIILQSNIKRYHSIFFPHNNNNSHNYHQQSKDNGYLSKLVIFITNPTDISLDYGFSEEYELIVHHPRLSCHQILLRAKSIYGALRGLETLSQMILYNFETEEYKINVGIIKDYPRFVHRGILLDTARHFHPTAVLKHFLDSLSYAKFNVFHWHIVDQESFPYESKAYPKLWNGSYSTFEKYSENDILDIIEYAKYRGIRVIPEFDTPGHAGSWCKGYPQLCIDTVCTRKAHPPSLLDPSKPFTWQLIDGLFKEASERFTDTFFHLGADEVPSECYLQDSKVKQWMKNNGVKGGKDIYRVFVERTASVAFKYNKRPIVWNEVWDNFGKQMDSRIIIHFWQGHGRQKRHLVMNDGFDIIVSYGWYLDHLKNKWQDMYTNEPLDRMTVDKTTNAKGKMLGGEACMWSETIDFSDLDSTVWPKAATVAERLWSAKDVNDPKMAANRYRYFRCLLIRRGIGASPSNQKVSRSPPARQDSCFKQ